jgi:hypothetical protein
MKGRMRQNGCGVILKQLINNKIAKLKWLLVSTLKPDKNIPPCAGFFSDHSLTLIVKA